jgi:hypothetical protein
VFYFYLGVNLITALVTLQNIHCSYQEVLTQCVIIPINFPSTYLGTFIQTTLPTLPYVEYALKVAELLCEYSNWVTFVLILIALF